MKKQIKDHIEVTRKAIAALEADRVVCLKLNFKHQADVISMLMWNLEENILALEAIITPKAQR